MLRPTLLCAFLLAFSAPTAHAGFADRFVPVRDASTGVTATAKPDRVFLRFGPKAANVYRRLAGKPASVGCGNLFVKTSEGGVSGSTDGPTIYHQDGWSWIDRKLPRRRGTLSAAVSGDVCFIATKERRGEAFCMPVGTGEDLCVRVLVATTDKGRADLDEYARTLELFSVFTDPIEEIREAFGADAVVTLPASDAPLAPGQVGLFADGHTKVAAAVLADGRRLYVSQAGDVYSTNVRLFSRPQIGDGLM